jgi:hypothetical protein
MAGPGVTRHPPAAHLAILALACSLLGCARDGRATGGAAGDPTAPKPRPDACPHAACGDDYYVDARSGGGCAVGGPCSVVFALVAAGDYHINDEYPYKFKADDAPGLEFLGTDDGGHDVFSKSAKNWTKTGERTGAMTVTFRPLQKGITTIAGTFKFSVCSAKNCELEHRTLKAAVEVL